MATDPWAEFEPVAAPAPSAPAFPGVIAGRPKPVDPFKVRDQQLQEEAAARAAAQFRATQEREDKRDARSAIKDAEGSESERTAGFLTGRIVDAVSRMGTAIKTDRSAQAPSLGVEAVRRVAGESAANYLTDAERQQARAAELDILDAALTLGTGAAYNREQLEGYRTSYFPQLGDDASTIESKRAALRSLLENARVKASKSAPDIQRAIATLDALNGAPATEGGLKQDEDGGVSLHGRVSDESSPGTTNPNGTPPGNPLLAGVGDIVETIGDTAGIIVNPVVATVGAITGKNYRTDLGQQWREGLGLPNGNETISAVNQGALSALGMAGLARGGARLASNPATVGALSNVGRTPIRDAVAGGGAGLGMDTARQMDLGPAGQVVGALAGGVAGYGGANALARQFTGQRVPNALMQSAEDLGVTMMPADVGGVGTRMATGAFGRTLGGIPIAEGAETAIGSAAQARNRIAGDIGAVTDNVGAGQAAKRGFSEFTKNSKARVDQLYENVSVPADNGVQLSNTRNALTEVTRGMQSNPALSRLWAGHPRLRETLEALTPQDVAADGRRAFMEASDRLTEAQMTYDRLRGAVTSADDLNAARQAVDQARIDVQRAQREATREPVGGELSWEDMKRFRSIVGEIIGQPGIQRDGSDIAALRKLYGAVTSDMEVTAAQAGPRALQEFRRATQYARGREKRIEDVFSALLGKDGNRSDEAVFRQINSWAQGKGGDFSRIARTIRSMPADEADTIRATLVQRMGMAKPANQDATGEVFSPALFSTEWRGLSSRAKAVLFPNQQHRQDLEKLAQVTDGMKRAGEYQNFSNTSLGVNLTAQGTLAYANLPIAAALAATQFGVGKLLASPKFARIIASSTRMAPDVAARRLPEQLKVLQTREPVLASEINALLAAMNDNAPRIGAAVASPNQGPQQEQ